MSEDEAVDGPKIAAQLLAAMEPERQKRISKRIQEKEPELAMKIEESMFRFEDLPELTSKSLQNVVQSSNHSDIVMSLRGASPATKKAIMAGMSEKKRAIVEDDIESMAPQPQKEVVQAQKRILDTIEKLREEGKIRSRGGEDIVV